LSSKMNENPVATAETVKKKRNSHITNNEKRIGSSKFIHFDHCCREVGLKFPKTNLLGLENGFKQYARRRKDKMMMVENGARKKNPKKTRSVPKSLIRFNANGGGTFKRLELSANSQPIDD